MQVPDRAAKVARGAVKAQRQNLCNGVIRVAGIQNLKVTAGAIPNAVGEGVLDVPSDLDRVLALDPGEVLRLVLGLVGSR